MERVEQEIIVKNPQGLHARPAALFVQIASEYDVSVEIEKDNRRVDGKSIIAILSLGINRGAKIKLIIEGKEANLAFQELRRFLEKND
ncbi:MAG: hypothetical protein B6D56_00345 [Candidatus Omnitrophica bacterium 4484_70.1]|nr:MAG: hypothetical protein B6D56_00345 [Candidatus Omnitrophica bacterium 4484_70.1]